MKTKVSTGLRATAMRPLAALAIVAALGLTTPSAFANIPLSWNATDQGTSASTSGTGTGNLATGTQSIGNFSFSITINTFDPTGTGLGLGGNGTTHTAASSELNTTTFTVSNESSGTDTLVLKVSGQNFTVGAGGPSDIATFAVSGSSSNSTTADTTTAFSWVDTTNTAFGTGTQIPPSSGLTGTPISPGLQSTSYSFTNSGNSGSVLFSNLNMFSMTQQLKIQLGAGDSVTLTINTTAVPTPEPSTLALAGLGALGLLGYGLRRRRTLGA